MGMIILPVFMGAIIICLICFVDIIIRIKKKSLSSQMVYGGIGISFLIFSLILLSFYLERQVYAFTPYFRFPFYMIYLPGLTAFILHRIKKQKIKDLAKTIELSIIFSGIMLALFSKYVFTITEYLNVTTYY